jgi:hypothetical protein
MLRHGGLVSSDQYDDGVYYAAADAFVHGRLPYRDFLFLQPPAVLLALAPFAWFGSVTTDVLGMVTARLAFMAIGALNAALVMLLARRFGRGAAIVAGFGYAVFEPAVYSERSTTLEPLGTLALLLALLLMRSARGSGPFLAGLAAGAAAAVKIWYVVPLAVLVAFQPRGRLRMAAGAATGAGGVLLPFFLADPAAMWRQVVLDQLGRPWSLRWRFNRRLGAIVGAPALHLHGLAWLTQGRIAMVLLAAGLVLGVAACTVRGARVFPALTLAGAVVLLASPTFFPHYSVLIAAPGLLTVGIGAARLGTRVRARWLRAAGLGILLAALVVVNLYGDTRRVSREIPYQVLTPAAARVRGCITADDPVLLAAMNVLSRDLARGCTVWPDVTGYTFDRDTLIVRGDDMPRIANPQWQRDALAYLRSGDAFIRDRRATGLSPATRALLDHTPVLAGSRGFVLHATR